MFFAGGSGTVIKKHLDSIAYFCDIVGVIDICIKLFVSIRTYACSV